MKRPITTISPALFATLASQGEWESPNHILEICDELVELFNSTNTRLIINMPPRHGKSEFISKYFPAWFLTFHPNQRVILTSYNKSFATQWCSKVKKIIKDFSTPVFGVEISKTKNTINEFSIEDAGGSLYCIGARGSLTGRGADLIIIDDPIKNEEEALSSHQRDKLWEWFKSTLFTRLEPNGKIIICMTRWHKDDLVGRIIE